VLIITCPCALGLAVPIVQVMAARRLFEQGVMLKDGSALERLAEADTILFDKTGTLTLGRPRLVNADCISAEHLAIAGSMSSYSRHPLSSAIQAAAAQISGAQRLNAPAVEVPGLGLEARIGNLVYRLGRPSWALNGKPVPDGLDATVLSRDGKLLARFLFEDALREGAREAVAYAKQAGMRTGILSGDNTRAVARVASALGIDEFESEMLPGGKSEKVRELAAAGRHVLMVGDGINDAPAMAGAHVSMAPATAADIGRNAADFVFLRESLAALPAALIVAEKSGLLIRQNFALAIGYNLIAVPIAVLGYVTPLVAAAAMSLSSILVVANAMRLIERKSEPGSSPRVGAPALKLELAR
jgi:Cu2+-exporting ATPase